MERSFTTPVEAAAPAAAEILADLANYPEWLGVVSRAEPAPARPDSDVSDSDNDAAWLITLEARIGPLARSKRLRMARTLWDEAEGVHEIRFDRDELDDRSHAAWTMTATVEPLPSTGSTVTVTLSYGGGMWSGPLDGVLDLAAKNAIESLQRYLAAPETP